MIDGYSKNEGWKTLIAIDQIHLDIFQKAKKTQCKITKSWNSSWMSSPIFFLYKHSYTFAEYLCFKVIQMTTILLTGSINQFWNYECWIFMNFFINQSNWRLSKKLWQINKTGLVLICQKVREISDSLIQNSLLDSMSKVDTIEI